VAGKTKGVGKMKKTHIKHFDKQPADRVLFDNLKATTEPWSCQWVFDGQYRQLLISSGYQYDGASVPRIGWTTTGIQRDGEIRAASLAHDALYRGAGGTKKLKGVLLVNGNGNAVLVSRAEADWVLREFMIFGGCEKIFAVRAYLIVRVFGKKYWGKEPPEFK